MNSNEARKYAKELASEDQWYADVNSSRNMLEYHYFQINDDVCLEYWGEHEWEFTTGEVEDKEEGKRNLTVVTGLAAYFHVTGISLVKIPFVIEMCRKMLNASKVA